MAHYHTFRVQIAIAHPAFGHALWEPDPGKQCHPVEVGDVGYIRQGKFHRLFNALLPESHPSHATFGVPEDHEPLRPSTSNHIDHGTLYPNNFCSFGVRVAPGDSEGFLASGPPTAGSVDVSFSCTKKQGAVLSLPVAARREDTSAQAHFRKWMTRHIDSWFSFTQRHGLGIEMEDIILVTGCHRTRSWTNIAFYEGQADARASFGVKVTDIYGNSVNWQASSQQVQGAVLSHGPSGENLPENQCIFVRGFRVKRSFKIFPRIKAAAEPPPDPSGNNDEREIEVVPISSVPDHQDPLHVLLEYIANRAPHCDLVLVHDDDLERILRAGDRTSLETFQPAEVMSYLHKSKLEVAVTVTSDNLPSGDDGSRRDTKLEKVAMLSEKLEDFNDPTSSIPFLSEFSVGTYAKSPLTRTELRPSFTEPIPEIVANISQSQQWLSALPRYHPLRPICASLLGFRLVKRYELSNQREDVDRSILYLTESLLSPPGSWLAHGPTIIEVLYHISLSLLIRSRLSKEPEDAIYTVIYLRHLRHTPIARHLVTALLVETLVFQMELNATDTVKTLEEMAVLTHELLTSDPSNPLTTRTVTLFARALSPHLPNPFPDQPLNQIIECLRLARICKPELLEVPFYLCNCLFSRYLNTHAIDDLDDAADVADEIIASSPPDDKFVTQCQKIAPALAMLRSMVVNNPKNSEEVIYRVRASPSVKEDIYPTRSPVLERVANNRLKYPSAVGGLEESPSDPLPSLPVPSDHYERTRTRPLDELFHRIRNCDINDIDEVIELGRTTLSSSDPSDLYVPQVFGEILFGAFERTNKIEYLNESINTYRQLLAHPIPSSNFLRLHAIIQFLHTLISRMYTSPDHRIQDLREVVELLPQYLDEGSALFDLVYRFNLTFLWANAARLTRHSTTSIAYETALSSMQHALLFTPTFQLQHAALSMHDYWHKMPLDYASYQADLGQLEGAIETLERGRAFIWSEMRHLCAPIDKLQQADPYLGDKFEAVNRDLKELTKSIPPSRKLSMDDVIADNLGAGDQTGSLLLRQRGLLKEHDKLISQIRALPGFDRVMTSPSFDTLRSAASYGPVIIINHSEPRSDILILLHNASPSLIPTSIDFYDRANALKDKLSGSRSIYGLDSGHYEETLSSVLADLYELIGKPVIDRLRQLRVPHQSRVWWCPTSVFCSLPLHAMGPIPSDDGELRYFLDLYICSYTPSLSALIQSRSRDSGTRSFDRPSVLLVAQTDPSLPTIRGEIQVVQALDTEVTSLISEAATPTAVLDGFQHHRFVHIACYGTTEAGKPFAAGFELYGNEWLTLPEIVRADLPTAEFAFLSACHTAEATEGSIIDECLHLAAAAQYSGFRSVVGTMWAMVDEDGRDLAENFYKALFSNTRRDQGIPYHERSAKALRFAVKELRKNRRIALERWVNFVHYGA